MPAGAADGRAIEGMPPWARSPSGSLVVAHGISAGRGRPRCPPNSNTRSRSEFVPAETDATSHACMLRTQRTQKVQRSPSQRRPRAQLEELQQDQPHHHDEVLRALVGGPHGVRCVPVGLGVTAASPGAADERPGEFGGSRTMFRRRTPDIRQRWTPTHCVLAAAHRAKLAAACHRCSPPVRPAAASTARRRQPQPP